MLDAKSLLAITPDSEIGEFWNDRRGDLTRTIVQLNAHAFALPPAASISAIRNCGPTEHEKLDAPDISRNGPSRGARDIGRSDIGKFVTQQEHDRFETRGTPAEQAGPAFQLLAEEGFGKGTDKDYNKIIGSAIERLLEKKSIDYEHVDSEKSLEFCDLTPDVSVHFEGYIDCIELTWRKGQFLTSANRATVARYILEKLKRYALTLNWI
jgi:hypothetical protein